MERGLNVLVPIFYRDIGEGKKCQLSSLVLHWPCELEDQKGAVAGAWNSWS